MSKHRIGALKRLGHDIDIVDPYSFLPNTGWMARWNHRTGGFGTAPFLDAPILQRVAVCKPDLIWINQGTLISPGLMHHLRNTGAKIVGYINDDLFRRGAEWMRFRLLRKALPFYDLVAVCRLENVKEALDAGARRVERVMMSADEEIHQPRELTSEQRAKFASEVSFIGTWMPERGPFLAQLIKAEVPLSVWGSRWEKAPEWPVIESHWRGPNLDDAEYAAAILASKICIGLLSKGNRDLHTARSLEVPALGGLLCGERTTEHMAMYQEGLEAVFWSSPQECAELCLGLLADDKRRLNVARLGHERALKNGYYNEKVLSALIASVVK
ncbi:MAG: glycosyltransferase [Formivibrio sp.]|nr:glycosyltransferase [Formivibrio sp.]